MIRLSPQFRTAVQRATLPILVLVSAAVVVVGKADQGALDSLRAAVSDGAAPLLGALSRPAAAVANVGARIQGVFRIYQDNGRLEQENERLLHWQQAALGLAAENAQLKGLLKLVPEAAVSFVTARVIATSGGAYVRTLMINAGSEDGLTRGQAAITGEGLVGRLTEIGARAARILLITDLNSRIPVIVGGSRQSAVLAGDNSDQPRLLYLAPSPAVQVGDRVVTSGEGGVFPPGLPVGVVATIDGGMPRIEPYVELSQIGYVRIVDYGLADELPGPLPSNPHAARHARPAIVATHPAGNVTGGAPNGPPNAALGGASPVGH